MCTKAAFILGVFLSLTAIILGAFATHSLAPALSASSLNSFNVGVDYQLYHGFALLILTALSASGIVQRIKYVILFWVLGWLLFSCSIYLLSTQSISGVNAEIFGPVTPIGGLLLMIGWIVLLVEGISTLKRKQKKT